MQPLFRGLGLPVSLSQVPPKSNSASATAATASDLGSVAANVASYFQCTASTSPTAVPDGVAPEVLNNSKGSDNDSNDSDLPKAVEGMWMLIRRGVTDSSHSKQSNTNKPVLDKDEYTGRPATATTPSTTTSTSTTDTEKTAAIETKSSASLPYTDTTLTLTRSPSTVEPKAESAQKTKATVAASDVVMNLFAWRVFTKKHGKQVVII
jgi:hypothetical protein